MADPIYEQLFNGVFLWSEFPYRKKFGGADTGIDLVATTFSGEYCAIQCKFYAESARMDKSHVDAFITTSARTFANDEVRTTAFTEQLWVSTTDNCGKNTEEAIRNQLPPVERINLTQLRNAPVDWEDLEKVITGCKALTKPKTLKSHQRTAVEKANEYFKEYKRGKLILACRTGKKFTILRIAENESRSKGLHTVSSSFAWRAVVNNLRFLTLHHGLFVYRIIGTRVRNWCLT